MYVTSDINIWVVMTIAEYVFTAANCYGILPVETHQTWDQNSRFALLTLCRVTYQSPRPK
jgi:hypothetical protein